MSRYEAEIEPLLDHRLIELLSEINERQKPNSLANARTLSFPIDWPEPFGLVMTEDMPVTAWRKELVTEVTVLQG